MGARLRAVAVVVVVLAVGAFLGSAVSQWWDGAPGARPDGAAAGAAAPAGERVRVEVLNGGGRAGMARAATERLRDAGFDVVYWGNASSFDHDSSAVVDRVGRPELARAVAGALGIAAVRSERDPNLYVDVSVVLGGSWEPGRVTEEPAEAPPWWDPRRFLRTGRTDSTSTGPGRLSDPAGDERPR